MPRKIAVPTITMTVRLPPDLYQRIQELKGNEYLNVWVVDALRYVVARGLAGK
jgi:hypothetical protein